MLCYIQFFHTSIILYHIFMGQICFNKKPENDKNYSTKSIKNSIDAPGPQQIKITTISINRTGQQCLLLFVDSQCIVQKNQFLEQSSPANLGYKIQQFLDVQLKGHKMNIGESMILNLTIPEFQFKYVAVLCINIWESSKKSKREPYQQQIEKALDQIHQKDISSICMTGFNTQFGIPSQIATRHLSRALLSRKKYFTSISVVCISEQLQNSLLEAIKNNQSQQSTDQTEQLIQSIKSDYY